MPCAKCGVSTPMLIKGADGQKLCSACFTKSSPMIDEGWRIVKSAMDNDMEWEDSHEIERRRARVRGHN
jgi:NMD protein affecting ribosome stability and mRNA decay